MVRDYNKTKFVHFSFELLQFRYGVDIFDETVGRYAYRPACRRWPLVIFMFMVNCAAHNAFIICQPNTSRRAFLNALSVSLMGPQKRQRDSSHWLTRKYQQMSEFFKSIKAKISGRDKIEYLHCHICKKVGRSREKMSKTFLGRPSI